MCIRDRSYIEQVYGDIQKVGRALKTAVPALNALLAAKLSDCDARGIQMRLDIRSSFEMCIRDRRQPGQD